MKISIKKILIPLGLMLLLSAYSAFAEPAELWQADGAILDFEGYTSETLDSLFEFKDCINKDVKIGDLNGSNALMLYCTSSGSDTRITYAMDNPLTIKPDKDYVFSFDFKIEEDGGSHGIRFGNSGNFLAFINGGKLYYGQEKSLCSVTAGTTYKVKFIYDGETGRPESAYVNGTKINISPYNTTTKYLLEDTNLVYIFSKFWSLTDKSYFDNITLTEIDNTENNIFFDLVGGNKDISVFPDGSNIEVRASLKSDEAKSSTLYLAVFEGNDLKNIETASYDLKKGMNYFKKSISSLRNGEVLKAYVWDNELNSLMPYEYIKDNSDFLEYKEQTKTKIINSVDINSSDYGLAKSMTLQMTGGKYDSITYTGETKNYCYAHCAYLESIAAALASDKITSSGYDRATALARLHDGIAYWISWDASNSFDNWYYDAVTVPAYMGKILLMSEEIEGFTMGEELAQYMQTKISYIDKASLSDSGSNILQMQRNKSYYAIYNEDLNMLLVCFERINRELRLSNNMNGVGDAFREHLWNGSFRSKDGIQPDYSMLYHGPLVYSGTYGLTFIKGVGEFIADNDGYGYFPEDGIKNLIDHILEHYAYIGRGETMDYNTIGRMISAKGSNATSGVYTQVYGIVEKLLDAEGISYRRDDLQAFYDTKDSGAPNSGHKFYWTADYTAHSKENYLLTLRTASQRTIGAEAINYYNRKGDFTGDGAAFIYRTGEEYNDIFASWDWHKVPGTTTETASFANPTEIDYYHLGSDSGLVGGVSDGNNGATAMQLVRGNISAKKAWFMFDDEYMALGTDITNNGSNSCYTTVNQCLSGSGKAYYDHSGSAWTVDNGANLEGNFKWALNDGIGYVFNGNDNVHILRKGSQEGNRYDISWDGSTDNSTRVEKVRRDVFTLWFDHTADNSDRYEYTVVPNTTHTALKAYVNPLTVISNTAQLQAVKNTKTGEMQAVFWTANTEADFDGVSVKADKRVLITLKNSGNKWTVHAASLAHESGAVNITVKIGANEISVPLTLPSGEYTGQTVEYSFTA